MIVILGRSGDRLAAALLARWAGRNVGLLTPNDLTVAGWNFTPGSPEAGVAVVSGRPVPARDVDSVVSRLSGVEPDDLLSLSPEDRGYVAAEMDAFLTAWLNELPCPVINRPWPGSLNGPPWTHDDWLAAAASMGMPVRARKTVIAVGTPPEILPAPNCTVSVVGDTCFGGSSEQQRDARRLASFAGVECLAVGFWLKGSTYTFATADVWIDVSKPKIADALLELIDGHAVAA